MKRLAFLICGLLLFASEVFAAIAFDAASDGQADSTTLTISHVVTGSNTLIAACFYTRDTASTDIGHSSVTYNSVALTQADITANYDASGGVRLKLSLWYLKGAATGTHDLVFTTDVSTRIIGTGASFTGVSQGTAVGTATKSNFSLDTTESTTVSSAAGELVIDCFGHFGDDLARMTAGAGQTIRSSRGNGETNPATSTFWNIMSTEAGAASVDMTYDWDATLEHTGIIAVPLKPVVASKARAPIILH
jgi:hypothetical protein